MFINKFDFRYFLHPFSLRTWPFSLFLLYLICHWSSRGNFIDFYHQRTWLRCQVHQPFLVGQNWKDSGVSPQYLPASYCGIWNKWKIYDLLLRLRSSLYPSLYLVKDEFLDWKGSSSILLPIQHFLISISSSINKSMSRKIHKIWCLIIF